jgi:translation initiation factor IF-2
MPKFDLEDFEDEEELERLRPRKAAKRRAGREGAEHRASRPGFQESDEKARHHRRGSSTIAVVDSLVTAAPLSHQDAAAAAIQPTVRLPATLTVKELGQHLGTSPITIIKALMKNGIMATINQSLDFDTAAIVAQDLGIEVEPEPTPEEIAAEEAAKAAAAVEAPSMVETDGRVDSRAVAPVHESTVEAELEEVAERSVPAELEEPEEIEEEEPEELLVPRPPVVTVMGHVDHGKTLLLDKIRSTNVVASEAGGITQHIGAYQVEHNGQKITFIDTPGHAAFTAMRARGARVTDIAVIVIAANEGVMPQTIEAISHARAAHVPIIVALNKMDLADANPDRVKAQLAEIGVDLAEWGGDVELVPISARTGQGIDDLLDTILVTAELANDGKGFRANPNRPARGTIIEARMDRQRGPMATVIVQQGTLRVGQYVVAGSVFGRVRAMYDDRGQTIKEAPPSTPVSILGLSDVPQAGDRLQVLASEKEARALAQKRAERKRARELQSQRPMAALRDLFAQLEKGETKELNLVVKADVQGSLEAITGALQELSDDQAQIRVLHGGVGPITESDVLLAAASQGMVIGFNVTPDTVARRTAKAENVEIRLYNIIYKLTEDIDALLHGAVEPVYQEVIYGHAEVRQVFRAGRNMIAGGYVTDGHIPRNATVRVLRNGEVLWTGRIASLKRFKEDVREVSAGYEFGIMFDGFNDFEEGDILEAFGQEKQ